MRSGKRRQPEIYMAYELSRVELSWRMETFPSGLCVCVCVWLCFNLKDFYLPPEILWNAPELLNCFVCVGVNLFAFVIVL